MDFEIVGSISAVETIAVGRGIRDHRRLSRIYGQVRWRKRQGVALVRVDSEESFRAEIH
jgi:hypothetical protein